MEKPTLVIMAAGMGSRYGGLKQIDSVDEQGQVLLEYSIYDAIKAGFQRVIFIIKKELEEEFKNVVNNCIKFIEKVEFVYQDITQVPERFVIPDDRVKPWGTGHAILCCKDYIQGPFAVINADDFYGREAFIKIYDYLCSTSGNQDNRYAMVGYQLKNTLTEHGSVARGICNVSNQGFLTNITERTRIEKFPEGVKYYLNDIDEWVDIAPDSTVSMNLWGFQDTLLEELKNEFDLFLKKELLNNPLYCEFYLPSVVQHMIETQKAQVEVLCSKEQWFGVTYKEDKEVVVREIARLKRQGVYPDKLWLE